MKRGKNIAIKTAAMLMGASMLGGILVPAMPAMAAGKTKTMHVVTSIESAEGSEKYQLTYNKSGLIKKDKGLYSANKYTYRNDALREVTNSSGSDDASVTKYYYNKKAQISRLVTTTDEGQDVVTISYDSKGHITTILEKDSTGEKKRILNYKYTYNKKNQITKISIKAKIGGKNVKQVMTYRYNKNGDLKKITTDEGYTWKYDYKYTKSGKRWTKATVKTSSPDSDQTYTSVYKYTYKKMQVPAKYAAKVQAQQDEALLTNGFGFLFAAYTAF